MLFNHKYRYLFVLLLATYTYINTAICRIYEYFHLGVTWYEAYIVILLITLFTWESNRLLYPFINKWMFSSQHIIKHAVVFCIAGFFLSAMTTILTDFVFGIFILRQPMASIANPLKMTLTYIGLINLLFHLLNTIFLYQQEYRKQITESETLKRMHAQAELLAVRQQINPHFLFNNLNVLSGLVLQKKEEANHFIEAFSQVYMHILATHTKEFILLREELKFLQPYTYLLQQRFPDALQIDADIPEEYKQRYIIPVALQMLMENAIKHNVFSVKKPLLIRLFIDDDSLVIENTWQPKMISQSSTKTGLQNIEKRYELATGKKIAVHKSEKVFSISLPLIEINAYESAVN